jgi:serine/threonine-protein kinase
MGPRTGPGTVASFDVVDEGAEFLQRRLRKLFSVIAAIAWIALITHIVLVTLVPDSATKNPRFILACFIAGAAMTSLCFWLVRPARKCSMRELMAIDAGLAVLSTSMLASIVVVGTGRLDEVFVSILIVGYIVLGHTLVVPRTWQRTLVLSLACVTPSYLALVIVALWFPERLQLPPVAFMSNGVFILGIPVALATLSSRVITGLRQQVRDARRLGQYTLAEKIAEGGLGTIYRAHHAMLRRPTAIKLLRGQDANDEAIRRFEREVQITAELTDPHIVAVYDYGRSSDGTFYYAMEYLDGIDLERLVRGYGAQVPGRVVSIVRHVCAALAEAHRGGLIHRDIKPANILLCERGLQSDVAKVVDFGLVQRLDIDGAPTGLAGTPGYIAPEAIADPSKVGASSDLYALGAVAYFLLTGSRVFESTSFVEMCEHHLHVKPDPPSARAPHEIPAELDALVLALLEKDPDKRPASAAALREALAALPVPAWTAADAASWWSAFRARPAPGAIPSLDTVIDPVARTLLIADDPHRKPKLDEE